MADPAYNETRKFRFDVALSFPGEHRRFVRNVAEHLAKALGKERVFFDEWYEAELAGKNGDIKLQKIYRDECALVVPFLSRHYKKTWCKIEWDAVRAMLIERRDDDAVMAVRMDNAAIEGWQSIDFHLSRNRRPAAVIASLILEKLRHESLPHKKTASLSKRVLTWSVVLFVSIILTLIVMQVVQIALSNVDNAIRTTSSGIKLKAVRAGSFQMGSDNGNSSERPPHTVSLNAYELGVYEVSQSQYSEVMNEVHGSVTPASQLPITGVSWFDVVRFCNSLSEREGLPRYYEIRGTEVTVTDQYGDGYRLPTEAEWEYACRAGNQSEYSFGDHPTDLDKFGWYDNATSAHPIGTKRPNEWGFYDMHGNVFEWCWDWYDEHYYSLSTRENPTGPESGARRATRGGSIHTDEVHKRASYCRSAHRSGFNPNDRWPNLGFRVARTPAGLIAKSK